MFKERLDELLNIQKKGIWIQSELENEVMPVIVNTLLENCFENIYSFSYATGLYEITIEKNNLSYKNINPNPNLLSVLTKYNELQENTDLKSSAIIFNDIDATLNNPNWIRGLRELLERKVEKYVPIIILSSKYDSVLGLNHRFEIVNYDDLDLDEIEEFLNDYKKYKRDFEYDVKELSNYFIGYNRQEIIETLDLSFYRYDEINLDLLKEKKIETIKRCDVLELKQPTLTMADIGGNNAFKKWYEEQKICMRPEARQYNIDLPKGYLALGIPGCAKSALAQAIANDMNVPLLELKMSNILSKFVGESERKMAQAQKIIESCAPCVLLIDEVEKALGGYKSSNSSDSGTLARVFGNVLQMLNDNDKGIFTIMTSNNVEDLPPELTRAGRLDGIWFFSTPTVSEREEIFKLHLRRKNIEISADDLKTIAKDTEKYTGAEIEQIVKSSMKKAYLRHALNNTDFKLTLDDLESARKDVIPVAESSKEKISALEEWVKGRALYANGESAKKVSAIKTPKKAATKAAAAARLKKGGE